MSASANPWGTPLPAQSGAPVKLHDVMDEELAAKLQREEEEEWEREIAAQFGDRDNVGWCFVEVPSSDCEFGVMSVIQQEVPMEEQNGDPSDPDYAFALELQAQEAEEYDRLRRQEASSMERFQVMKQSPQSKQSYPHRQLRHFLGSTRSRRSLQREQTSGSSGNFPGLVEEGYEYDSDDDTLSERHNEAEKDDHTGNTGHEDETEEDMFFEDDLPLAKFNALDITLRGLSRKNRTQPPTSSSSGTTSTAPASHHNRKQYSNRS